MTDTTPRPLLKPLPEPLHDLLRLYKENPANKHLRFGQWFINNYVDVTGRAWPELFYAENIWVALGEITKEYYK